MERARSTGSSARDEYIKATASPTMLERNEGFPSGYLLDHTRQVCAGLETPPRKGVTLGSLEPAKIMVQWDGLVQDPRLWAST